MAFWLDPAHRVAPEEFSFKLANDMSFGQDLSRLPGNGRGPLDFKLPVGVTSVMAVDAQNGLIARGTQEGLRALDALITAADVPLVQYEVEARFCQIDLADLPQTGLKFPGQERESPDYFGSVALAPLDWEARLSKLQDAGRLGVLSAPRLTLIDGLAAQVQQSVITPLVVDEKLAREHPQPPVSLDLTPASTGRVPIPRFATQAGMALLTNSMGLRAALVRQSGGLVSLSLSPSMGMRTLSVQTTVREEQPLAIRMSPAKETRQLIVFVTPRRIQRIGE